MMIAVLQFLVVLLLCRPSMKKSSHDMGSFLECAIVTNLSMGGKWSSRIKALTSRIKQRPFILPHYRMVFLINLNPDVTNTRICMGDSLK